MRYLLLLFILTSCFSDEKPNFSNQEFRAMAEQADPGFRIITPKSISESLVNCNEYKPACRYGFRVVIKNIEMVALYYEDQKNALAAAKRIREYVSRNWVLDEVRGEPVLEKFCTEHLEAKKAF